MDQIPTAVSSLTKTADFRRLKTSPLKWVSKTVIVQMAGPNIQVTSAHIPCRIGYTVTRHMGGAVQRNRIKRRFRAACRDIFPKIAHGACDYVLIARKDALNAPFSQIMDDLTWCLRHVHRLMVGAAES